jgi:hypothetical protein
MLFRRRVLIHTRADGPGMHVRAALEDDYHHFRVQLHTLHGHIAAIQGEAPRHPYSLCPGALAPLAALKGLEVLRQAHAITRQTDAALHCTHLLDLTGLALAAAVRGHGRHYEVEVPVRVNDHTEPRLWVDGAPLLHWQVQGDLIKAPPSFNGVDLRLGMARWALSNLPDNLAEAALVLRRCTTISKGRTHNLDLQIHARSTGYCHAQQPERAALALRRVGSTWDFTDHPKRLCADDLDWLAGV